VSLTTQTSCMRHRGLRSLRPPLLEKASYVRDTSTSTASVHKSKDRARVQQEEFLRSGGGQYTRRPLSAGRERRARLAHDDREWLSSLGPPQDRKKRPRSRSAQLRSCSALMRPLRKSRSAPLSASELPRDDSAGGVQGTGSCRSRLELALVHADLLGIRYVAGEWLEKYRVQENSYKHLYDMVEDLKVEHDLAVQLARSGWKSKQQASPTEEEAVWHDGQPYRRGTSEIVPESAETTAELAEGADPTELQQSESMVFGGEPEEELPVQPATPSGGHFLAASRMPGHYNRLKPRVMRQRRIAGSGRKARVPSDLSGGRPELAVAGPLAKHVSADLVCAAPGPWGHPATSSRPQSAASAARRSEFSLSLRLSQAKATPCLIQVPSVKEITQCAQQDCLMDGASAASTGRTTQDRQEPEEGAEQEAAACADEASASASSAADASSSRADAQLDAEERIQHSVFSVPSAEATVHRVDVTPYTTNSTNFGASSTAQDDLEYQEPPRMSIDIVTESAWRELYSQLKSPAPSNRASVSSDAEYSRSPRKLPAPFLVPATVDLGCQLDVAAGSRRDSASSKTRGQGRRP